MGFISDESAFIFILIVPTLVKHLPFWAETVLPAKKGHQHCLCTKLVVQCV